MKTIKGAMKKRSLAILLIMALNIIISVGSTYYLLNPPIPKKAELHFVLDEAHLTEEDEIPSLRWFSLRVLCPHDGSKLVYIPHVYFSSGIEEEFYDAFYCKAEKIFWVRYYYLGRPPTWYGPFVCESARFRTYLATSSLILSGITITLLAFITIIIRKEPKQKNIKEKLTPKPHNTRTQTKEFTGGLGFYVI